MKNVRWVKIPLDIVGLNAPRAPFAIYATFSVVASGCKS